MLELRTSLSNQAQLVIFSLKTKIKNMDNEDEICEACGEVMVDGKCEECEEGEEGEQLNKERMSVLIQNPLAFAAGFEFC